MRDIVLLLMQNKANGGAETPPDVVFLIFYCFEQFLPCGYSGSSKNPAHTSCEYSCAGGMAQ